MLRNVCWIDNRLKLFLPHQFADLADFLDFSHVSIGEFMSEEQPKSTYLQMDLVFGHIPIHARFAANITHYAMIRHTNFANKNFGHLVWEEFGGVFHAMHLFDLPRDDGRIVLFNNHAIRRDAQLYLPRTPAYIDEYPNGTCFEQMVAGFRGISSLAHGFSLFRTAHTVEFRKFYLSLLNADHLVVKTRRRERIVVNMYPKVVVGNAHVWNDVCKLSETVEPLFPKVQFRCISLHDMSIEVQSQAISEATVHIWPNGDFQAFASVLF
jgi:hypothetical protein